MKDRFRKHQAISNERMAKLYTPGFDRNGKGKRNSFDRFIDNKVMPKANIITNKTNAPADGISSSAGAFF